MSAPPFLYHAAATIRLWVGAISTRLAIAFVVATGLLFAAVIAGFATMTIAQQRTQLRENLQQRLESLSNAIDRFDAAGRQSAQRMSGVFGAQFDGTFELDAAVSKLKLNGEAINADATEVDRFAKATGGVATVFMRKGDDFVRIASSLKAVDGERVVGTALDRSSAAYANLSQARAHVGIERLSGQRTMVRYEPVVDSNRQVIAILSVGFDMSDFAEAIGREIDGAKLFDTGGIYAVELGRADTRGELSFHRRLKGQKLQAQGDWGSALLERIATSASGMLDGAMPTLTDPASDTRARDLVVRRNVAWGLALVAEYCDDEALAPTWRALALQALSGAAALLVLGALLVVMIGRLVGRPLRELRRALNRFAEGDLSEPFRARRLDEVGRLITTVERARVRLAQMVTRIRTGAEGIATASSQVATGNGDLSGRTEEQASSLEQTASSIEHLTQTVRSNAHSSMQANALAQSASQVAHRGGEVVGEVVERMRTITESSRRIAEIIGVIDTIAFQTNILALNAAVEAARAGEQGRGFAVVAGEVRSLAQRSAQAAREIKDLISESVTQVESGSKRVRDAGATMAEIVSSVSRVTEIIGEISAATGEQSVQIGQVNTAVGQLEQMTQQNAALVEQSAAAAESMNAQALALNDAVSVFRLGDSGLWGETAELKPPLR